MQAPTDSISERRLHIIDRNTGHKFLIDSGSTISIYPKSFTPLKLAVNPLILHAANSTTITTYGQQLFSLDLGLRRTFQWLFTIADISTPIIGADFVANHGLLIDLKGRRLLDPATALSCTGQLKYTEVHSISTVKQNEMSSNTSYLTLIKEFQDITTPSLPHNSKHATDVVHRIITTGQPVAELSRKLAGQKLNDAKAEIQAMLDFGIIRPSKSPWASPFHMQIKPPGDWRPCRDYRKLNAQTVPDRYPAPLIQDLFPKLHA